MKKQLKYLTMLSAAAMMTAAAPALSASIPGSAAISYAASVGWVTEDGELRYLDSEGYYLTDTWKKKDNEWYYLNEEGFITRSAMVDEYYVNEEGKRVINQWIRVDNEDEWDDEMPEAYWYYYGKD